jgi:hypothetical protein
MHYITYGFLLLCFSCFPISISLEDARIIGDQIWHNECNASVHGLTTWRTGEDFASLGIGHFIWYPKNIVQPFKETFPDLIQFMKQNNVILPKSILALSQKGCPWKNRKEFYRNFNSKEMIHLRHFLHQTIDIQTKFMLQRMENALPSILKATPYKQQAIHIKRQFYRVLHSDKGVYALIDYLNFKGEGLEDHKLYNNVNWGLKQVLLEMKGKMTGPHALQEFAQTAKKILERRVENAPEKQKALEQQWLKGWFNRIDTYVAA